MLLRGSVLTNTDSVLGIVVYVGMTTKVMSKKKPKQKVSNIMRIMNQLLYSLFVFQFFIVLIFTSVGTVWTTQESEKHYYL